MAPPTKKPARAPKEYVANRPVGEGAIHLNSYWGVDFGDQSLWATSLVSAKRRKGKSAPGAVDLENAITGIQITDTIAGFSTIVVKFEDPEWKLIRSGFFDANEDGRLDALDVNYPVGSDLWWRASQVSVDANRASASISLTFIERAAAWLLNKKGPLKAGRTAKRTRAQFLKGLTHQVKAGELVFHCQQLGEAQAVEKDTHKYDKTPSLLVPLTDSGKPLTVVTDHPKAKTKGIHKKADVTIKGVKAVDDQIKEIETCMKVADRLSAPPKAVKAMLVAGIGESEFRASAAEQVYGTHKGVFQSYLIPQYDTEQQCTYFFKGDRSFLAGGAIGLVKSHPEYSVGTVAAKVEKSDGSAGYYDGFAGEADKIMVAYGHGGLGSTASDTGSEYRKQYNFEVGGPDHPGESFWEAMVRIAGEVKWALFLDGNHVYYDAETTLIRAKPATYIDRLDESVVSFSSTWDSRNIASEATLELICDPFEFRAGDTLVLRGFGPSSTGSTVKPPLPGRWLIDEVDRDRFDFTSTFRLKQPVHPSREPLGELGRHKGDTGSPDDETFQEGAKGILKWVKAQVGTQEGSAKQVEWANDLGFSASLPWCSIFIGTAIKKNTSLSLPDNPAYSGGWMNWSDGTEVGKSAIQPGDIVIFDWGDGGQTDHVAMYIGGGKVVGGNQSNKVSNIPWDKGHTVAVIHPHYHDTDHQDSPPPSHPGINTKQYVVLGHGKVVRQ
jgi:hypothetical protein